MVAWVQDWKKKNQELNVQEAEDVASSEVESISCGCLAMFM